MGLFNRNKDAQVLAEKVQGMSLPMMEDKTEDLVNSSVYGSSEPIGTEQIKEAQDTLQKYKEGKSNLETRIVEDELWWELRHWEAIGKSSNRIKKNKDGIYVKEDMRPEPTSAWLFNAIASKHADAMDNYPEPIVLPREKSDEISAKNLSSVLPVVMEQNGYDQVYSDVWWEKLKHGSGVWGVFWNQEKENGIGDIDIHSIDLLNLFWEPGITDIQKSKNVFVTELVDVKELELMYPEHEGEFSGKTIDVKNYIYDDSVDTEDKVVVVDWYYKKKVNGRDLLHYCKFCCNVALFASENDPLYQEEGYYSHGMYPIVIDNLYPEKGTPVGFGYVSICKDPQLYIDKLSGNILENSMMATKKRFFASTSAAVNKEQFLDWDEPIVEVQGEISDARLKEITVNPLDSIYITVLDQKINEMKETASNRDVSNGGGSSVTAASAIAALQEAGNKISRDMISGSYRAYTLVVQLVIELMRQFYDESRSFRIVGETGAYEFINMSNQMIKDQPTMMLNGEQLYRKPVFDLKVKSQKKNPFSRMEQNETAKELYKLGFFNPQVADQALIALDMMDFEGIDKVKEKIINGQIQYQLMQQMMQQAMQPSAPEQNGTSSQGEQSTSSQYANGLRDSHTPEMTSYGKKLAERSKPDMNRGQQ